MFEVRAPDVIDRVEALIGKRIGVGNQTEVSTTELLGVSSGADVSAPARDTGGPLAEAMPSRHSAPETLAQRCLDLRPTAGDHPTPEPGDDPRIVAG